MQKKMPAGWNSPLGLSETTGLRINRIEIIIIINRRAVLP